MPAHKKRTIQDIRLQQEEEKKRHLRKNRELNDKLNVSDVNNAMKYRPDIVGLLREHCEELGVDFEEVYRKENALVATSSARAKPVGDDENLISAFWGPVDGDADTFFRGQQHRFGG